MKYEMPMEDLDSQRTVLWQMFLKLKNREQWQSWLRAYKSHTPDKLYMVRLVKIRSSTHVNSIKIKYFSMNNWDKKQYIN